MLKMTAISSVAIALLISTSDSSNWSQPFSEPDPSWGSDYVAPETQYGPGHRGVDLALEIGSKIKAPVAGRITFADLVVDRASVTIQAESGYLATFEPACTTLKLGDRVTVGSEFAWHCSPNIEYRYHCKSCVHFSVRSQFGYLSPDYFLTQMLPSQLVD